ncbi:MAG: outer membrane protein OmpA-like peptidoglycan-associated protein [Candidatus Latescibacterota bacterium]|jgi:outer membrane protein OmpA-like peptidoglycan-associated protein/tetratricopeptide (TPR) repeat protein
MKKIYTFFLLIAVSTAVVTAQNKDTKKADQLYSKLAYTDAAKAYQKLIKKGKGSRYVFAQLGNSFYNLNDTKKAASYYKRVVKARKVSPEVVYNYAQCLKANGKFSDYNTNMQKYAGMMPKDSRAVAFMKDPNYLPKLMEEQPRYEAKNMKEINTEFSEFGGIMIGKEFYFSSARNLTRKKYQWDEQRFLDIYVAKDVGGTIKNADLLGGEVNGKYHEGNVAITADGKRMYFDSNDFYKGKYEKSAEGINQINLFYAELIDGEWKGVQSTPFNSSEYSTGHPALSPDGNTLYFTSDMPGGKGGSDIYMLPIGKDGSLGTPKNLGDKVNTEGTEAFPSMDSNGTLYFSSDGHSGLGLLDVFSVEQARGTYLDPLNLGAGVNSDKDDFAYIWNPATMSGFVSSDRSGGAGSDDIYMISELEIPCVVAMNITVVDEYTKQPISGARVDFYDKKENKLSTKTSGANGGVTFLAECDKAHEVQAVVPNYESNAITMAAANDATVSGTIALRPIEEIIVDDQVVLNPILFDYNQHNIKPQAAFELDKLVAIMQKYPNMVIAAGSHTDNRGNDEYNLELSEQRAQSTVQYVISKGVDASRITGKGYGETQPTVACGSNCSDEDHQKNRRSEFIIVER